MQGRTRFLAVEKTNQTTLCCEIIRAEYRYVLSTR